MASGIIQKSRPAVIYKYIEGNRITVQIRLPNRTGIIDFASYSNVTNYTYVKMCCGVNGSGLKVLETKEEHENPGYSPKFTNFAFDNHILSFYKEGEWGAAVFVYC